MTAAFLANAPAFAVAGLLFLATALCRRLERYYARREAAFAEYQARPRGARLATPEEGEPR
ncbi:hypothetical protein [Streptomyces sp. NPDC056227]|uniref:hypothetical protein n=1 Tax=Streptomyces sp. NPDC056227 TaxID=3345753 RepID=UPI0035D6C60C